MTFSSAIFFVASVRTSPISACGTTTTPQLSATIRSPGLTLTPPQRKAVADSLRVRLAKESADKGPAPEGSAAAQPAGKPSAGPAEGKGPMGHMGPGGLTLPPPGGAKGLRLTDGRGHGDFGFKRMAVGPAVGLMLQVQDGESVMLISKSQVVDEAAFVAAWTHRSRGTYAWEDGTPAVPEEIL